MERGVNYVISDPDTSWYDHSSELWSYFLTHPIIKERRHEFQGEKTSL